MRVMTPRPALIGLPYDASSSFLRGAAEGPARIRAALRSSAGNAWAEALDVAIDDSTFDDLGDLELPADERARASIAAAIVDLTRAERPFVALGGDHSVTLPILRGFDGRSSALTILQFDAHPDLHDSFEGDRYSHACPFARIMEEGLAQRLVQVGIRAATPHQLEQARRFGVQQIDMTAWLAGERPHLDGDLYISFDLDVLDPAFAPGVSHHEPGGLSTREALALVQTCGGRLVAADVVEFNPARDHSNLTATVAAKLVKELLARLVRDRAT